MSLTVEQQAEVTANQTATRQAQAYYLSDSKVHNHENGFDSMHIEPNKRPLVLQNLLEMSVFKNSLDQNGFDSLVKSVDEAVQAGIAGYKANNGGLLPSAELIALALETGKQAVAEYDSMTNLQPDLAALAPAVPAVTILNVIASGCPIIAYLPNAKASYSVPIIFLRLATDARRAGLNQGEFLDGQRSGQPYLSGRYEFLLQANASNDKAFSVIARSDYKDADASKMLPDEDSVLLPFQTANASILLNGIEIAHARGLRPNSEYTGKDVKLLSADADIVIDGKAFEFVSGKVNAKTSQIDVVLNNPLPTGSKLTVRLRADLNAKDGNKQFRLNTVGASLVPMYDFVQAGVTRFGVTFAPEVNEQISNELNIGVIPYVLGALQSTYFLENHIRLLIEGKKLALGRNRRRQFDAQRSVVGNLTNAVNSSGDIIAELEKYINASKMEIAQSSGGVSDTFVLYVANAMATWLKCLDSSKYTSTNAISTNGKIVQIGMFADGTAVYHTPNPQGVLTETETTAEVLLVGRSQDAVQNPCVCSLVKPPTIETALPDPREGYYGCIVVDAIELNPLEKFREQFAVIEIINLQNLKTIS